MHPNQWLMNRAGLINFWYYDEEIFDFIDGKLLLRGSNGSGKSVTMQSFIPLLLDGNKSPERLDPFGSKARKIENYLLGEEENGKDESIGYLFIEFQKEETKNFLTIGLGFKAVRGKPLKSWGFTITDNRRIGHGFLLYKNVGEKLPLTQTELENRIGTGGTVKEGQKDYMKLINDLLFGFSDLDEYDELIKLLVQLRSPKLSKEFRPTVIYEILENSLQPLSDEDLRPMTEAIENMDNIKSQLDSLKDSKKATDKIKTVFEHYNQYMLVEKASALLKYQNQYEKLLKDIKQLADDKASALENHKKLENQLIDLDLELKTYQQKKNDLSKHDSVQIKERLNELIMKIEKVKSELAEKERQIEKKADNERDIINFIEKTQEEKVAYFNQLKSYLKDMEQYADEFGFEEHAFFQDEFLSHIDDDYNFHYVQDEFKKHREIIEKALKLLENEERIKREYDQVIKELDQSKMKRGEKSSLYEQSLVLLSEEKENYTESIYKWEHDNQEFKLSDDSMQEISREVVNYEENNGDKIFEIVRKEYIILDQQLQKVKNLLINDKEKISLTLENKQKELLEWKTKREPEPERNEYVLKNRELLTDLNIPYIPFYQTIDFIDSLDDRKKGLIEEALLDMGILDALVIPNDYKEKVLTLSNQGADKYLFASPVVLSHHLGEVLKVSDYSLSPISKLDIQEILESILYNDELSGMMVNEVGQYSIGIIKGKTSTTYIPKYIGNTSRERYKQEMIVKINSEIDEIMTSIYQVQVKLNDTSHKIDQLKKEYELFPSAADLITAIRNVKEMKYDLERVEEEVVKVSEKEQKVYQEFKKIKAFVLEITRKMTLTPSLSIYTDALSASRDYQQSFYEFKGMHQLLLANIEKLTSLHNQKEEIEMDLDHLRHDQSILQIQMKEATNENESFEKQLELSDYDTIKAELDLCLKHLDEIPEEQKKMIRRSQDEKNKSEILLKDINDKKIKESEYRGLKTEAYEAFIEEFQLGYVYKVEERDYIKFALKVVKEISEDKKSKSDFETDIYTRYYESNSYLREYNLKIENLFDSEFRKRIDLTAKVRGKEVPFYQLCEFIEQSITDNELLLKESDRQLFEDILVKNISKKIRARIYHSDEWVKKMNTLMESMNTSSGLSFNLKWINNKAEDDGQLDTKELVDLLKQDGNLLKEQDLNRLSEHFRSKINKARRNLEDKGVNQTFHSIIKEVLDYRKWFEFKLFYIKTGQSKKELTNHAFYQFSGGEKAMAMYVPLFSAVYARYESARSDSPRLISLDEAFAGVDEQNIRDMFRLLNELDLRYIMNSQILWGDYDTVPALSICELVRPDNADFVTVIRYKWNGKVREML